LLLLRLTDNEQREEYGLMDVRLTFESKSGILQIVASACMSRKVIMPKALVVVVTGSSAGLGRAIAHGFAKRGASVGLIARNPEALNAAKEECEALGGKALALPTDVSDSPAVEAAASRVEEEFGPIDIWVNDAMVSVFSPVKEMEASDYKRVTDVLYLGFVHGTLAALRRMLPRDRGTIIQIGSALSYRSIPLQSAYCACKHAINGFTDSLRCELHHDNSNVKLTAVQMPAMNTTQFDWVKNRMPNNPQPVPPIFEPELTAEVVVAAGLAKQPRREYWVGSPTVMAIVGQKFIPGLLDWYLGKTGYKSQQIPNDPKDPNTPDNLYSYVPGTHSTRGKFTDRSSATSAEIFASLHLGAVVLGAAVALTALGGALIAKRKLS
jgi:NAD(P)-dependent dehydrogenase (short-subunit alcohol dehydrogenase family)